MSSRLLRVLTLILLVSGIAAYAGAQATAQNGSSAKNNPDAINSKIDDKVSSTPASPAPAADPGAPANDPAAATNTASPIASGTLAGNDAAPSSSPDNPPAVGNANQSNTPQFSQREPRYQLVKNDVVNITFPFTPEYNEVATVQPDGFINLKQLPDMKVEGMTTAELTAALTKAYSKTLHDPVITITLQNFVSPYFIAQGEVNNPGKFQLSGDTSLTQAIGIAGGFSSRAKHSDVYLFRRVSNEWVSSQKLDVKHMLASGNLAEDLRIQPGDMIWVPKSGIAKALSVQPLMPYNFFRLNFGGLLF